MKQPLATWMSFPFQKSLCLFVLKPRSVTSTELATKEVDMKIEYLLVTEVDVYKNINKC